MTLPRSTYLLCLLFFLINTFSTTYHFSHLLTSLTLPYRFTSETHGTYPYSFLASVYYTKSYSPYSPDVSSCSHGFRHPYCDFCPDPLESQTKHTPRTPRWTPVPHGHRGLPLLGYGTLVVSGGGGRGQGE